MSSASQLSPRWGTSDGWTFADEDVKPAREHRFLHQVYRAVKPCYTGKVTVPVLWDDGVGAIVNNESAEIIRMLNSEFDGVGGDRTVDFYPAKLRVDIDSLNAWLLADVL